MDDKEQNEIINELFNAYKEQLNSDTDKLDSYIEDLKRANYPQSGNNRLELNESLKIMLDVVHYFKYTIDVYHDHLNASDKYDRNKEIEDIINNRVSEAKEKSYYIDFTTLLLQVLYAINGGHYRINDPDYALEEDLDRILNLPRNEFDSAITKSFLLPLYYATHPDQYYDEK